MKAIKIDVVNKTVSEITIGTGFKDLCNALESGGYERVRISPTESLWVDDEGLLKDKPLGAFDIECYPQTLSGHGVIFGVDGMGESVDTALTVEQVKQMITFRDPAELPEPSISFISF